MPTQIYAFRTPARHAYESLQRRAEGAPQHVPLIEPGHDYSCLRGNADLEVGQREVLYHFGLIISKTTHLCQSPVERQLLCYDCGNP